MTIRRPADEQIRYRGWMRVESAIARLRMGADAAAFTLPR